MNKKICSSNLINLKNHIKVLRIRECLIQILMKLLNLFINKRLSTNSADKIACQSFNL